MSRRSGVVAALVGVSWFGSFIPLHGASAHSMLTASKTKKRPVPTTAAPKPTSPSRGASTTSVAKQSAMPAIGIVLRADESGKPGKAVDSFPASARVHRVSAAVKGYKAKRFRWAFRAVTTLGGDDIDLGGSGNVIGDLTEVVGAVEFPQGAPEGTYRVDLFFDTTKVASRTYEVASK